MEEFTIERIYVPSVDQSNCLNAIADPDCPRDGVAGFYADCIRCANAHGLASINWHAISAAIVERWSRAALEYIKKKAWKKLEAEKRQ